MKLKSSLPIFLLTLLVVFSTGCNLFRKNKKPKENPNIAAQVEADFRERWVDRRVEELGATGGDAATAHAQALNEFQERYPYIRPPRK